MFEYPLFHACNQTDERGIAQRYIEVGQDPGDTFGGGQRAVFLAPDAVVGLSLQVTSVFQFRVSYITTAQHRLREQCPPPLLVQEKGPGLFREQSMPEVKSDCFYSHSFARQSQMLF